MDGWLPNSLIEMSVIIWALRVQLNFPHKVTGRALEGAVAVTGHI